MSLSDREFYKESIRLSIFIENLVAFFFLAIAVAGGCLIKNIGVIEI